MMKTFWTVLKVTAVAAVALIGVLVAVLGVWGARSASRLRTRIEAVRSSGEPVSLAELARPPIPPEANAAVVLRRAEADLEAIQTKLLGVFGSESYDACRPTDAELDAIRSALAAHPSVIGVLRRAADCPDYDSQPDYRGGAQAFLGGHLEDVQKLRAAARFLKAHALLLESEGKLDQALEQCIVLLRLARHFDREPMIVSYLVGVACRGIAIDTANHVLRTGPVSQSLRDALDAELAAHDSMEAFRWALKSERAFGLESYQALPGRRAWLIRARWDDDASAYLDMIDGQLTLTTQPYCDVVAATEAEPPGGASLAELAEPAILAGRAAADRNLAMIRCLRVLNALQALEQKGDAPEPELSDLGLPAEATIDPFTGEPLKLKRLPEGWLVYSQGQDLTDDGGKLDDPRTDDVGVGPP